MLLTAQPVRQGSEGTLTREEAAPKAASSLSCPLTGLRLVRYVLVDLQTSVTIAGEDQIALYIDAPVAFSGVDGLGDDLGVSRGREVDHHQSVVVPRDVGG